MSQSRPLLWRNFWKRLRPVKGIELGGVLGSYQGGVNYVSQVNGEHEFGTFLHWASFWEESSAKEQWSSQ